VIARLRGRAVGRRGDALVLEVGGVGYLVAATRSAHRHCEGGAEVTLETYTHVREDALQLYGFADADERELFELLLGVSGVGPKVALAIVSGSPAPELRRAIALEDTKRFEAIPGIGRKTAQRVVMELKEKLGTVAVEAVAPAGGSPRPHVVARDALVELGFTVGEAEERLSRVDEGLPAEERVRLALRAA
jgi:Holliday junction DNA helicase RuvA